MKHAFLISGENHELAKEEIKSLTELKKIRMIGRLIIADCDNFDYSKLAFTHNTYETIFVCNERDVYKNIDKINWDKTIEKDYYVRTVNTRHDPRKLADSIWDRMKKPRANIKNPRTIIDFIFFEGKTVCGKIIYENEGGFGKRKAHHRPGFHPTSLHPKLARAMVNLAKADEILDPFCGTGGILIEAGLTGRKATGMDIDKNMLAKAKMNMEHYGLKNYKLEEGDATKDIPKGKAIATDPPYGKGSLLSEERESLYKKFLDEAYKKLNKGQRAVMIMPNKLKIKNCFKTVKKIDFYIHKSLTRTITILEKQ